MPPLGTLEVFRTTDGTGEDIAFTDNVANARVLWKIKTGSLSVRFNPSPLQSTAVWETKYVLGVEPVIWNREVYFQDWDTIYTADASTGKIEARYKKPLVPTQYFADLNHPCLESEKIIYPSISISSLGDKVTAFLSIDTEARTSRFLFKKLENALCAADKSIEFQEVAGFGFSVNELDSNQRKWSFGKFFKHLSALEVFSDSIVALYNGGNSFFVQSFDLETGKFRWKTELKAASSRDSAVQKATGLKELIALKTARELFVIQHVDIDAATGEVVEFITSLDPRTGRINWQKPDIVQVFTKQYDTDDNLFYLLKRNEPDIIYGVDQKTGEEELKINAKEFNATQGILSTHDALYYAENGSFKKDLVSYTQFKAVDKKTGKLKWALSFDPQSVLPLYANGILYFQQQPYSYTDPRKAFPKYPHDAYRNFVAESIERYKTTIRHLYTKADAQNVLSKSAFAVAADSGKILWKVRLEGGDEAYIEKILVDDNRFFLKSLSGWLYAIETGKAH